MKTRFFSLITLSLLLVSLGLFSCIGTESGGGLGGGTIADAGPIPTQNSANPENPPSTVSLDPNCKRGAKPEGSCKGSPFPVPFHPCPSNLTVIKNLESNVWWCACPEGTQEVKDAEGKNRCICPSGEGLWVNVDKGESLGCPNAEIARDQNPCPSGLVYLEDRVILSIPEIPSIPKKAKSDIPELRREDANEKWKTQCGCPAGSQIWRGTGVLEGQQGCQCPSGQLLPVDPNTGKATKTCEELAAPCRPGLVLLMPVSPGHVNFCGCPNGTEFLYPEGGGAALGCKCPSGARVQVDPQTSEMIGSCAVNL